MRTRKEQNSQTPGNLGEAGRIEERERISSECLRSRSPNWPQTHSISEHYGRKKQSKTAVANTPPLPIINHEIPTVAWFPYLLDQVTFQLPEAVALCFPGLCSSCTGPWGYWVEGRSKKVFQVLCPGAELPGCDPTPLDSVKEEPTGVGRGRGETSTLNFHRLTARLWIKKNLELSCS